MRESNDESQTIRDRKKRKSQSLILQKERK
jgi:hypothetical protein